MTTPSLARRCAAVAIRVFRSPGLDMFCRFAMAGIFLYAGLPKMFNPQVFLMESRGYQILPDIALPLFSVFLPALEVVVAIALLVGVWPRASASLLMGLMVVFVIAIISAMVRGLDIECGCFITGETSKVDMGLLLRDLVMMALLLPIFAPTRRWLTLWPD